MLKVEMNNKSKNPFTGMSNVLRMYQNASKGNYNFNLEAAWDECKTKEQKTLFLMLCFSIGDITGRQHNLFKGTKVDSGGYAERTVFRKVILPFLWSKVSKSKLIDNTDFLEMVVEYTVLDNILATRVRTKKKTQDIIETINMPKIFGIDNVVNICERLFYGNDFQKLCLAKFLVLPKGRKQKVTKEVMNTRVQLLTAFCDKVGLPYQDKGSYINFTGYRAWRKPFNANLESVLFTTGRIMDLDQEMFLKILNIMPSGARFRTIRKINKNEKYVDLREWVKTWESFKETAQTEERNIEEAIRQGTASNEDVVRLKEVKRNARVTTGAINFRKMLKEMLSGKIDKLKIQPFMNKINLPYNTLVLSDDSGSMESRKNDLIPRWVAALMITICLLKNPDAEASNLVGLFSSDCRFFTNINKTTKAKNSLLRGVTKSVNKPLIDRTADFMTNFNNVRGFLKSESTYQGTNVSSVAKSIIRWINNDPNAVDYLQNYPIWTFISDGNFNNLGSASASLGQLFKLMESKVGFKPYVLMIDVAYNSAQDITSFTGMDNIIMVPPNPANIEMILSNFKDIDVYDVYTPLLSLYRSNRYRPILELTKAKEYVEELVN